MLVAHCANNPFNLEIEGDFSGLIELTHALTSDIETINIQLSPVDYPNAETGLALIRLTKTHDGDTAVDIKKIGRELYISGPRSKLDILSQNIRFLVSQGVDPKSSIQNHIHIDWYPGQPYLAAKSTPLVITFRSSDAA